MKINKKWKIFIGLIIISGAGAFGIIKFKSNRASKDAITEVKPIYGNISISISTNGTVQPQNRLEIKPPISGQIEKVLFQEGDTVKKGDVLAWMSSAERAALLDAARARGEEAVKYWEKVYNPAPLIAPIDGKVIVRAVEPGQTIAANTPVMVLSNHLIVIAKVDETDIGKIKVNQTAVISLDAYPKIKVKGRVDQISYESKIVNNVTTYDVNIVPEKVPEIFRSGMSANVEIIQKEKKNILLIPVKAVTQNKENSFVLLKGSEKNEFVSRQVTVGISDDKNMEIISGIVENDTVIIKTQKYRQTGSPPGANPFMPGARRGR